MPDRLRRDDADAIVDLERRAFIPPLQATLATVLRRFELGHTMLGVRQNGRLVAMVSYSLMRFDPEDFSIFPRTLTELCQQSQPADYNATLIYNLEVEPGHRGLGVWKELARASLNSACDNGCRFAVSNMRVPSYSGSVPGYIQEAVAPQPGLRAIIDNYLRGGSFPSQADFLGDPLLALYHRFSNCKFQWIIPGYAPGDIASGGLRVIAYRDLLH